MRAPGTVAVAALLAGCSSERAPTAPALTAPAAASASPLQERVEASLDGVPLTLEVADEPVERATGLMRRASVPPGTGMLFLFDELVEARFYMYDVPIPLRAVFVRDGRVVSTVVMAPCALDDPAACPTYGADEPYDAVVETAPETLPDVQPGDELVLAG